MSSLARRSVIVLGLLFGLVFAVGTAIMWHLHEPIWLAVLFALAIIAAQYAAGPWILELIYKIRWVEPESIHPEFARWYRETCAARRIPVPRFGIIDDGKPNAFTYGHVPGDARVVVTSGLLQMLTPAEAHAVVAHELGHVANRDFIVMTLASAVPLVLYVLYAWTRGSGRSRNSGGYGGLIALGAYVAYWISQYVVLLLSRVREYFADEASALSTRDPNALTSALVKIAYGLAVQQDRAQAAAGKRPARAFDPASSLAGLGISSMRASSGFAMAAADATGRFSPGIMARVMQWDLKNPWARWFEFNSTHPLTARRIEAMSRIAERMQIAPLYSIESNESTHVRYSGNLPLELLLTALPALGGLAGLAGGLGLFVGTRAPGWLGLALIGAGAGWLIQMAYAYRSQDRRPRTIESLLEEVNVSHITPVPCVVDGEIIGRGVPGLFWSKDLVMRDATGFVTLQYRQPLGFFEFFFGWLKAGKYVGRPARVTGWYRRAPVPYVEARTIEMLDGQGGGVQCYYLYGIPALASLLVLLGALFIALSH